MAGEATRPGRPGGPEEGLRFSQTMWGRPPWLLWGPRVGSLEVQPCRGPWSPPGGASLSSEPWTSALPPHLEVLGGKGTGTPRVLPGAQPALPPPRGVSAEECREAPGACPGVDIRGHLPPFDGWSRVEEDKSSKERSGGGPERTKGIVLRPGLKGTINDYNFVIKRDERMRNVINSTDLIGDEVNVTYLNVKCESNLVNKLKIGPDNPHELSPKKETLNNYVVILTAIFAIEAFLKILAFNLLPYLNNGWNAFDFIIVLLSFVDWGLTAANFKSFDISVIRSFRMLRVFKLAKSWKTLNVLITVIFASLKEMGNLTVIVVIVIYIFAVIGMQLVGKDYLNKPETLEEAHIEPEIEIVHSAIGKGPINTGKKSPENAKQEHNVTQEQGNQKQEKEDTRKMKPCCPSICSKMCSCFSSSTDAAAGQIFNSLRSMVYKLVNNTIFDGIVLFVILVSTVTLALDDKYTHNNAKIQEILQYLDYFYTAFFNLEMLLKLIGLGAIDYFTNIWTLLDFLLVVNGWLSLLSNNIKAFSSLRSLRTLRALRPLRAISRWEGMRLVVNALIRSIPSISNVMLVCLVFWLIFGIVGVQIYGGKFYQCVDRNGQRLSVDIVNNITDCQAYSDKGFKWVNTEINFDNIMSAYLALLQVVRNLLDSVATQIGFSPTMLRVLRLARLGRLLRLVRSLKGIRRLIFTLIISIPALFNIGILLFLVMFIYSILGMNLFRDLPRNGSINEIVNFETFANSMLLLFRLTTAAGWNDVLQQLLVSNVQPNIVCILFMSSYILISFIVIVNMYVAVILENFNQAQEQEMAGVTDDDIDMFYEVWSKYDPFATQFILYEQLSDFLDDLKPPMRIPKPNAVKLAALNLPVTNGNKLHCLDILRAMCCVIVGNVKETDPLKELQGKIVDRMKKRFPIRNTMQTVTTTLMIRKEVKAAMTIQKAFRRWRKRQRLKMANMRAEKKSVHSVHSSSTSSSSSRPSSPDDVSL
ncbi:SCN60 protein, partial [Polypterus senegalus]